MILYEKVMQERDDFKKMFLLVLNNKVVDVLDVELDEYQNFVEISLITDSFFEIEKNFVYLEKMDDF